MEQPTASQVKLEARKTIRMRKEDWEKWDKALRSGLYEQAKHRMYQPGEGYCCLGVLQHCLTGKVEQDSGTGYLEVPSKWWRDTHGIQMFTYYNFNARMDDSGNPMTINGRTVAEMNDSGNYDFVAIADEIKKIVEFTDDDSKSK